MKNRDIRPGDLVPKHIRLEVYRALLLEIEKERKYGFPDVRALLLHGAPSILWDAGGIVRKPLGWVITYDGVCKMFPEFKNEYFDSDDYHTVLTALKNAISRLEK